MTAVSDIAAGAAFALLVMIPGTSASGTHDLGEALPRGTPVIRRFSGMAVAASS